MATKKQSTNVDPKWTKAFKIKKSVFHANEDGTTETRVIVITYYPDSGAFETPLPAHLHPDANYNALLQAETALGVTSRYEAICEQYSRQRLSMNGPRLLWVGTQARASEFAGDVFGIETLIGLGMQPVIRYTDTKHGDSIVRVDKDGKPSGEPIQVKMCNPILIADTPENRAKVQSLIDSIVQAAAVLEGARAAADPAAYIQAINDRWTPPYPVDPRPAAKPDDDEEL